MINDYLFVYGTLRRYSNNDMSDLLDNNAGFVDYACYQGRLYQINDYPGAVPSDDPRHLVQGEVFLMPDANWLLTRLDRYEGCGPGFREPNEYRRQKQDVLLNNGKIVSAWIYLYNLSTTDLQLIKPVNNSIMTAGSGKKPVISYFPNGNRFGRQDEKAS